MPGGHEQRYIAVVFKIFFIKKYIKIKMINLQVI
jgi:hypothetical protein